jgi:class 3 adenylate cyclase
VPSDRHLSVIMFTDMVGFTTLTQNDEDHALHVLEKRHQLLRPLFAQHHGTWN